MRACLALIVIAACGGGPESASIPDASPPSTDAPPPACHPPAPAPWPIGPSGSVTLTVASSDFVTAGLTVFVQDGTGTRSLTTDAAGEATIDDVHTPATITVVEAAAHHLVTITGVEPGDQLCIGCLVHDPPPVGSAFVDPPAYPGATRYTLDIGGGGGPDPMPGSSLAGFPLDGGAHDIVAVALDASGGALAWAAAPGFTLGDGQLVPLGAWRAPATFTATYDHVPGGALAVEMARAEQSSPTASASSPFARVRGSSDGDAVTVVQPATTFGGPLMHVYSHVSTRDGYAQQNADVVVAASSTYHVDASRDLLPWISNARYDACAGAVSWTQTGGRPADGAWIDLTLPDDTTWSLLVAPDQTTVTLPSLPGMAPPGAAVRGLIWLEDLPGVTSYRQMRSASWSPRGDLRSDSVGYLFAP